MKPIINDKVVIFVDKLIVSCIYQIASLLFLHLHSSTLLILLCIPANFGIFAGYTFCFGNVEQSVYKLC